MWTLWHFAKATKNLRLGIFHVNFGLRGEASDGDERHSAACAAALGLPFHCLRLTAADGCERHGESLQAWARRLRRAESQRLAAAGWAVALGHHRGDLAETVLMRLARGAAPGKLLGMVPWREPFWRPLLGETKADLRRYLAAEQIAYREDATNEEAVYSRNVVRQRILPELERLFPGAAERLVACAQDARDLTERLPAGKTAANAAIAAGSERKGEARHALAALIAGADAAAGEPTRQLSRRWLDAARAAPARATDVPRGGHLVPAPGGALTLGSAPRPVKQARTRQHEVCLDGPPGAALLEPGSHAIFRSSEGLYAITWEIPLADDPLTSVQATMKRLPAKATLRFPKMPQKVQLRTLLKAWGIPEAALPRCRLLAVDGRPVGLFDGRITVQVGADGKKRGCSQPGLNLRYLRDGSHRNQGA